MIEKRDIISRQRIKNNINRHVQKEILKLSSEERYEMTIDYFKKILVLDTVRESS